MIRGPVRRHGASILLALLAIATLVVGAFVLAVAIPELQRAGEQPAASVPASGIAAPSPSGSTGLMSWLGVPDDAECSACHLTAGGVIGLRLAPQIAHPLEGWSACTSCHAPQRLVETAAGHVGIHATACLTCHQPGDLPEPLARPHRESMDTACLDCHGSEAPLPEDMAHRTESVCWLCHRLPERQPPAVHRIEPGQTDCLGCHVAGEVGALPADHATRTTTECLLCHAAPAGYAPAVRLGHWNADWRRLGFSP